MKAKTAQYKMELDKRAEWHLKKGKMWENRDVVVTIDILCHPVSGMVGLPRLDIWDIPNF